jgi:hypothetical protein
MSSFIHNTARVAEQVSPPPQPVSLFRGLSPMSGLEALTALHYGAGAAVAFARRGANGWQECGACLAAELSARWPALKSHFSRDAYFTLASTYDQHWVTRISALGLPLWSRKTKQLRWLNVVALDLDRHEAADFSVERLLESFWRELEWQAIPLPTFVLFSGRGLWALWQIVDHKNRNQPVPAFSDKCELAQRISHELVKRFAPLGADRNVTDSARVMRVPDSVNSNATAQNSRVRFFRASVTTYTLPELAAALGVRAQKVSLPGERTAKDHAKANGARMRWRYPLDGFRALWRMRGGFTKFTRRPAIYVLSMLLRKNRATPQQILTSCMELAESFTPALSAADVKRAVASSEKAIRHNVSNARLAQMLKITAEEQAALPRWFRPAVKRKSAKIAERRALITQELSLLQVRPSSRRLVRLLAERHGIAVSRFTVARDLRSICGAFPVLIEPRASLCISSKNAPPLTETEFKTPKAGRRRKRSGSSRRNSRSSPTWTQAGGTA